MEVLQIIDEFDDLIEKSFNIFGFAVVNKEELLAMADEIRLKMPEELNQARWVKKERQKIIDEANAEAEKIVKEAQDKVIALIDEHEITKSAKEKSDNLLTEARRQEEEMKHNAVMYADAIMERLDKTTSVALDEIREARRQLKK